MPGFVTGAVPSSVINAQISGIWYRGWDEGMNVQSAISAGRVNAAATTSADDRSARFVRYAIPAYSQLARRASRLARSHADAEDLLQETMLKAYNAFSSVDTRADLKPWLYRIMYNAWISEYRSRRSRPEQLTGTAGAQELIKRGGLRPAPSAEAAALDLLPNPSVASAFIQLPSGMREVLYYADIEGYSYKQIGDMLNIPRGTVTSRLHRGRQRLRTLLLDPTKASDPAPDPGQREPRQRSTANTSSPKN
jgi:RNA polymerase sigma factor (sigma-70 family)